MVGREQLAQPTGCRARRPRRGSRGTRACRLRGTQRWVSVLTPASSSQWRLFWIQTALIMARIRAGRTTTTNGGEKGEKHEKKKEKGEREKYKEQRVEGEIESREEIGEERERKQGRREKSESKIQ